MKKLVEKLIKLNAWWDSLKEPGRFLYFMLFVAIPMAVLISVNILVGMSVILLLCVIRMVPVWSDTYKLRKNQNEK